MVSHRISFLNEQKKEPKQLNKLKNKRTEIPHLKFGVSKVLTVHLNGNLSKPII